MLLHEFCDGCVDEHELSDDVGDVDLAGDLVAGLVVGLHPGPVGVDSEQVEEGLKVGEQEEAEVVGAGGDLGSVVGEQDLAGEADLVSLFGVRSHDEDEANDGADQPPHVGEVSIELVEGPLVGYGLGGLPEDNLSVGKVGSLDI